MTEITLSLPAVTLKVVESKVEVSFAYQDGAFVEVIGELLRYVPDGVSENIDACVGDLPKRIFSPLLRELSQKLAVYADALAELQSDREA